MGLRPVDIFKFFQCRDRLYTSESAVHRRQILTYKDGPHTERVKYTILLTAPIYASNYLLLVTHNDKKKVYLSGFFFADLTQLVLILLCH